MPRKPDSQHRTALRVRYPETDRMGVAYHAHYLVWFELGRTELMRGLGVPYGEMEDQQGIFFPVAAASVRYRRSARYDDRLTVETRVTHVGGARIVFEYSVVRDEDEVVLATGSTEHAAVGTEGRPIRLPQQIREKLETHSR